jgi:hypothetical protein
MDISTKSFDDIRASVRTYVEGMTFGDEQALRRAFHAQCKIIGHYEGALEWLSLDDFIDSIRTGGTPTTQLHPSWTIAAMDVTGDAASVKVNDEFMGMTFTDYLSLLKVNGAWVIVNKLYYVHP